MTQVWLMVAFPLGRQVQHRALRAFKASKHGRSWHRLLGTRDAAIGCKRELVAAGIAYRCSKIDKPQPRFPAHARPKRDRGGFGGALNSEPNRFGWRLKTRRK